MIIGEAAMAASLLTYRYGRMDKFVLNDICPTGVALGRGSYGCVVEVSILGEELWQVFAE